MILRILVQVASRLISVFRRSVFGTGGLWLIPLFLVFWLVTPVLATDFSGTNFIIKDPVLNGSSGSATSSSFGLRGTIGELGVGLGTSTNFGLRSGSLYFPTPPSPSPSPTPSPSPSPSTGGSPFIPQVGVVPPLSANILVNLANIIPVSNCKNPALRRSDYNCDGKVNLRDLSILFSASVKNVARNLSFLFSDWTEILPRFATPETSSPKQIATTPTNFGRGVSPTSQLAQVGGAAQRPVDLPSSGVQSFFGKVKQLVKDVLSLVLTVFRLLPFRF